MALARAKALRTFQSSLRSTGQRIVPRVSAPARTQLLSRRYASGGGGHAEEASSDIPWLLGAIAVTVPSCWYLWPDTSHADHHGAHGEHDEHAEEGGEEAEGEEKQDDSGDAEEKQEDAGVEDSPQEDDKKFEQEEEKKDDAEPTKDKEGDAQDSMPPGGDDAPPTEEQETSPGGGGGKDDETETKQVANQRKLKKKPDSGQRLGAARDEFEENVQGGPIKENAATAKDPQKGKYGEITGKQFGLSTGETKHSLPIDSDPNKSKKGEGTPETAKAQGTVDPNRPAR